MFLDAATPLVESFQRRIHTDDSISPYQSNTMIGDLRGIYKRILLVKFYNRFKLLCLMSGEKEEKNHLILTS